MESLAGCSWFRFQQVLTPSHAGLGLFFLEYDSMAFNINTALGLSNKIPGINVAGAAVSLLTGGAPSLNDLVFNPYNPFADMTKLPDPILSHTWYVELPGYDFGIASGTGLIGGAVSSASGALGNLAGSATNALGGSAALASNIAAGVAGAATSALSGAVSGVTGLGYEYVIEATCPLRQYEARTIFRNGRKNKYPGSYDVGNMRLTVYGDSQGNSFRYLNAWHNSPLVPFSPANSNTRGGMWAAPAQIKRPITVVILAPDLSKVAYISYIGCWITNVSEIALDASKDSIINYAVDISVDDVFVTIAGAGGLLDAGAQALGIPL